MTVLVGEVVARFRAQANEFSQSLRSDVTGALNNARTAADQLGRSFTSNQSSAKGFSTTLREVQGSISGVSKGLTEAAASGSRFAAQQTQISQAVKSLTGEYRALAKELAQLANSKGSVSGADLDQVAAKAKALVDKLGHVGQALNQQGQNAQIMAKGLGDINNQAIKASQQLDQLNQPGKTHNLSEGLNETRKAAEGAGGALGRMAEIAGGMVLFEGLKRLSGAAVGFVHESINVAARSKEMDVILGQVGKSAGQTTLQMNEQVTAMKHLGIQGNVAKDVLANLMRVGLPTAQAGKLARVAQDAAVIAGGETTDTLQSILYGVQTRQTDVLRNSGINIDQQQALSSYAATLHIAVNDMTEAQKQQALLNEVIRVGAQVQGSYEAALTTGSKQLRSTPRLLNDIQETIGNVFEPAFSHGVFALNGFLKAIENTLTAAGPFKGMLDGLAVAIDKPFKAVAGMVEKFSKGGFKMDGLIRPLQTFKETLAGMGSVGGAVAAGGIGSMLGGLVSQLPIIGQFLGPINGVTAAMATLVITNRDLRSAVVDLFRSFMSASATISAAMLPVWKAINDAFKQMGPSIKLIVQQFGEVVQAVANMAAGFLTNALPAIKAILGVFATLVQWLAESKVGIGALVTVLGIFAALKVISTIDSMTKSIRLLGSESKVTGQAILGLAAAGAIGVLGSSIPNKAVQQGSHALAAGVGAGIMAGTATGNPFVGVGVGLAAAGITLFGEKMGESAKKTRDAADAMRDLVTAELKIHSAQDVIGAHVQQVSDLKTKVQDAKNALVDYAHNKAAMKADISAGPDPAHGIVARTRELEDARNAAQAAQNEAQGQLDEARKKVGADFVTWADSYVSDGKKATAAMGQSVTVLNTLLGNNAAAVVDWQHLTTAQMDMVVQKTQQFLTATASWADEYLSIVKAVSTASAKEFERVTKAVQTSAQAQTSYYQHLADLNKLGGPDLAAQGAAMDVPLKSAMTPLVDIANTLFQNLLPNIVSAMQDTTDRAKFFMSDVHQLIQWGMDPTQALEILKAGPAQMGDAVGAMVDQLGNMTSTMRAQWLKNLKETFAASKQFVQEQAKEIARAALVAGGATKVDTLEQAQSITTGMLKSREALKTGIERVSDGLEGLKPSPAANAFKAQVNQLLRTLADGKATTQDIMREYAKALDLGAALKKEDSGQADLVDHLTGSLDIMHGFHDDIVKAGQSLSLGFQEGFFGVMDGMPDSVAFRLKKVQDVLDHPPPGLDQGGYEGLLAQRDALRGQVPVPVNPANAVDTLPSLGTTFDGKPIRPLPGPGGGTPDAINKYLLPQINKSPLSSQKSPAEIADDITATANKVDLWRQAVDKAAQSLQRLTTLGFQFNNAGQTVGKTIGDMAANFADTESALAAVHGQITSLTDGLIQETEQMIANGKLARDAGAANAYLSGRVQELKDKLPGMIDAWLNTDQSLAAVTSRIDLFNQALQKTVGIQRDATTASYDSNDALDKLTQTYNDNQALLTNTLLTDKDRRQLTQGVGRDFNAYTKSIEEEAAALAKAGKIGNDYASIQKFIDDKLTALGETVPGLRGEIDQYKNQLDEVKPTVESSIKVYTEAAVKELEAFDASVKLYVPPMMTTILQIQIDQATLEATRATLAQIRSDTDAARAYADQQLVDAHNARVVEGSKVAKSSADAARDDFVHETISGNPLGSVEGLKDMADKVWTDEYNRVMHVQGIYDVGGTLPPGVFKVMNQSGRNEFVLTAEQYNALLGLNGAGGGGSNSQVAIDNLNLTSSYPPSQWLTDAMWHISKGLNPPDHPI